MAARNCGQYPAGLMTSGLRRVDMMVEHAGATHTSVAVTLQDRDRCNRRRNRIRACRFTRTGRFTWESHLNCDFFPNFPNHISGRASMGVSSSMPPRTNSDDLLQGTLDLLI